MSWTPGSCYLEVALMHRTTTIAPELVLLNLAGSLSLTAALFHAIVMPEHFREWWGYGLFFFIAALAQAVYGIGLLVRAWRMRPLGVFDSIWQHRAREFYLAGIIGNLAIILLFLITRTLGIPLGPDAGEVEAVTTISLVSTVVELALVGCLLFLLANDRSQVSKPSRSRSGK